MSKAFKSLMITASLVSISAFAQGADGGGILGTRQIQLPQGAYSIKLTKVEYPTMGQAVTYDESCLRDQAIFEDGNEGLCAHYNETRSNLVSVTVQYTVGHSDPNMEDSLDPIYTQEEKISFYPQAFSANALNQITATSRNSGNLARSLFSSSTSSQSVSHVEAGSDSPMCMPDENGQLPFNGVSCQGEQTHTVTERSTLLSVKTTSAARI